MEKDKIINIKKYSIFLNKKIKNQGLSNYYLAIDNYNQTNYMCKIISLRELTDIDLDDLKKYKQIRHNNILNLENIVKDINNIYLLFKYIKGITLYSFLNKNRDYKFDENDIFNIITQIIKIILFLYDEKIILFDLTLNNILLNDDIENDNDNDLIPILLCNLEEIISFEFPSKKQFLEIYNKIVYQLGVIICTLLDNNFFEFLEDKEINENNEIINEKIKNNILSMEISDGLKEVINHFVLQKYKNKIELLNTKQFKWLVKGPNQNKSKLESNSKRTNKSSIQSTSDVEEITNSCYSKKESLYNKKENNRENKSNKKPKLKEEVIITDEGYLELKKKEKEVLLGIIEPFDKDRFIQSIILSEQKENKNINENNEPLDDTDDIDDKNKESTNESEQSTSRIETKKRRRRNKSKDKSVGFWICK